MPGPGGHGGPGGGHRGPGGGHRPGGPMGGPRGPRPGGPRPGGYHRPGGFGHYGGYGYGGGPHRPYHHGGCLSGCLTLVLGAGGIVALIAMAIGMVL